MTVLSDSDLYTASSVVVKNKATFLKKELTELQGIFLFLSDFEEHWTPTMKAVQEVNDPLCHRAFWMVHELNFAVVGACFSLPAKDVADLQDGRPILKQHRSVQATLNPGSWELKDVHQMTLTRVATYTKMLEDEQKNAPSAEVQPSSPPPPGVPVPPPTTTCTRAAPTSTPTCTSATFPPLQRWHQPPPIG